MEKCLRKNSNIKLKKTFRKTKFKVCVYNINRGELVSFFPQRNIYVNCVFSPPSLHVVKFRLIVVNRLDIITFEWSSIDFKSLKNLQLIDALSYHIISWWGVCSVSIICFVIFPLSIYAHFSTCCSLWAYRYQVSNGTQ